jgi:hypothetical protein
MEWYLRDMSSRCGTAALFAVLLVACGDDTEGSAGSAGTGAVHGEGMYGRADCHGEIVEAECGPADLTIIASTSYFMLQCFASGVRFEVWVYDPVRGELSDSRSEVYFVCPGDELTSPMKVHATDGPGAMTVDDFEIGEFISGEFSSPSGDLEGWFNARDTN